MEPEFWRVTAIFGAGNTRKLAFDTKYIQPALVPSVAIAVRMNHRDVVPTSGAALQLPAFRANYGLTS